MKELSIKQKAKAYDEAIERAKEWSETKNGYYTPKEFCEEIFPELKESEDERIRKELIEHIKANCESGFILFKKFSPDEVIAWLEKQGKQELPQVYETQDGKTITYSESEGYKVVKPKFHEGEWIVWKDKCYKVNYNGCGYELVDQDGLSTSLEYGTIDENAHLWDVTTDAKDGDVLF